MTDRLRLAMLGLEHPHCESWQRAFNASEHCTIVGLWSETRGLAQARSEAFGAPAWDDRVALVEACDAVAILSTTAGHTELIELAAEKGKKILCEKPIGATRDDCRRIEAAVRGHGAYFMQGFPKRFDPINAEIKALVDSGELGQISLVRVRHGHPFGAVAPDFGDEWFADRAQAGGGTLLDEGVHAADLLRWLLGDPATVTCVLSDPLPGHDVETTGAALYRYDDGTIAEITTSWHFIAADNSVEVFGTRGALVLSGVDLGSRDLTAGGFLKHYVWPQEAAEAGHTLAAIGGGRSWQISPTVPQFKQDTDGFHQNVARVFVEHAGDGRPPPVTLDDGLRSARMIFAAYEAAASGRAEPLRLDE